MQIDLGREGYMLRWDAGPPFYGQPVCRDAKLTHSLTIHTNDPLCGWQVTCCCECALRSFAYFKSIDIARISQTMKDDETFYAFFANACNIVMFDGIGTCFDNAPTNRVIQGQLTTILGELVILPACAYFAISSYVAGLARLIWCCSQSIAESYTWMFWTWLLLNYVFLTFVMTMAAAVNCCKRMHRRLVINHGLINRVFQICLLAGTFLTMATICPASLVLPDAHNMFVC
jgi:hypothetical protein